MSKLETEHYEYSILVSRENSYKFKKGLEKLGYSWGSYDEKPRDANIHFGLTKSQYKNVKKNSEILKLSVVEEENNVWICEECNEENELNFDTCWNCQTFSEKDSKKAADIQIELKENDVKQETEDDEINALKEKIYHALRSYKLIIYPLALIIVFIICASIILLDSIFWDYHSGEIIIISLFIGFIVSEYILGNFFRKKVIQNLGLSKHRYYNQISVSTNIKFKIIFMGIICITLLFLAWYGESKLKSQYEQELEEYDKPKDD